MKIQVEIKSTSSFRPACRTLATAEHLASSFPRTKAIRLDVSSPDELDKHISIHNVVVSLVPPIYHGDVIKSAIKSKTQVVTASYISEVIRNLEPAVKEAGISVISEVGGMHFLKLFATVVYVNLPELNSSIVDPGVDHLYAIKKIDEVHAKGGRVLEFYSFCGGLPAPDCTENPLGFKFSWSPRGALLSQRNFARFLKDGNVVEISSNDLMSKADPYFVKDGYDFVAYPNRDSVPFREFYKIPEAHTVIRGSLRYKGNPAFIQALANLGWLDQDKKDWLKEGMSWAEIQQQLLSASATDEKYVTSPSAEKCDLT